MDTKLFNAIRGRFAAWETRVGGDALLCSGWSYVPVWRPACLGRLTIGRLGYFRLPFLKRIEVVAREIVNLLISRGPVLVTSGKRSERKTLLFSWYHNTEQETVLDRYLGPLVKGLGDDVGRIYVCDGDVPGPFSHNIDGYFLLRRRIMWNVLWCLATLGAMLRRPLDSVAWMSFLSVERRNAVFISRQLHDWLGQSATRVEKLVFAYEQQPWQCEIISQMRRINPRITTFGYAHSSLTNLPAQFIRQKHSPDFILVHGVAFKRVLVEYLGWRESDVKVVASLRYSAALKAEKSTVFAPYEFENRTTIINAFDSIIESGVGLNGAEVRIHPDMRTKPEHVALKRELEERFANSRPSDELVIVTVGMTTVTIEALEAGYTVFGVFEDPDKDALAPEVWREIEAQWLSRFCYRYALKESGSFIKLRDPGTLTLTVKDLGR